MGWQSDWLYTLVFAKITEVWNGALQNAAEHPDLFGPPPASRRVQECGKITKRPVLYCVPPVIREWQFDGTGFALSDPPYINNTDPKPLQIAFFTNPVLRFHIQPDRQKVVVSFVLGPRYGGGYDLLVRGEGPTARLEHNPKPDSTGGWMA